MLISDKHGNWVTAAGAQSVERLNAAVNALRATFAAREPVETEISIGRSATRKTPCPYRKSYPAILVMEPAQDRKADNVAGRLDGTR